ARWEASRARAMGTSRRQIRASSQGIPQRNRDFLQSCLLQSCLRLALGAKPWACIATFSLLGLFPAFEAQASPVPTDQTPSIILISIDTLRADHLSCYGYRRIKTSHIDAITAKGTLFSAIHSQVPLTFPSHVSLFTSTYPFFNGVEDNGEALRSNATT